VARFLTLAASPSGVLPRTNRPAQDLGVVTLRRVGSQRPPDARRPWFGVGATTDWDGNRPIGLGRQTIVARDPDRAEFRRPPNAWPHARPGVGPYIWE